MTALLARSLQDAKKVAAQPVLLRLDGGGDAIRTLTLLVLEIDLEGWWTSLDVSEKDVIQFYADHGTSEQFHSEFKTDITAVPLTFKPITSDVSSEELDRLDPPPEQRHQVSLFK